MHYANANASAIKVKFGSHGAWKSTKRGENLVSCDRFTIRGNRCSEHYFLARNYREKYGIVRLIEEFEKIWRNSSTYFIFKIRKDLASLFFNNFLNVQRIIENEISLTISYIRVIPVLNSIINYVRLNYKFWKLSSHRDYYPQRACFCSIRQKRNYGGINWAERKAN